MIRKPGFYWLRSKDRWSIGEWRSDQTWWIISSDGWFEDSDFDEIDERRIEREQVITVKGDDLKEAIERAMKHLKKPI